MELIDELRAKFAHDAFEFSKHAADQSILRAISVQEIREAVSTGEIIEDYPQDKYGPSCCEEVRHGKLSPTRTAH